MPKHVRYPSWRHAALILAATSLLSACWTIHEPEDIALVRVAVADDAELPKDGRLHSFKYSDPGELIHVYPNGKLLAVTLSSRTNLVAIERYFYYEAAICTEGREAKLDTWSVVFEQREGQLFQVALLQAELLQGSLRSSKANDSDTSAHLYKIYFFDRLVYKHGTPEPKTYNLSTSPQDVCITFHGTTELLPPYQPNTIVIPAAELNRALN